jgi:hypothetical protein
VVVDIACIRKESNRLCCSAQKKGAKMGEGGGNETFLPRRGKENYTLCLKGRKEQTQTHTHTRLCKAENTHQESRTKNQEPTTKKKKRALIGAAQANAGENKYAARGLEWWAGRLL